MTAHTHTTLTPGCFRCDLGRDAERDDLLDRAAELDGPGAIVSHAEVLDAMLDGVQSAVTIAADLGVSPRTVARAKANLRRAGIRA